VFIVTDTLCEQSFQIFRELFPPKRNNIKESEKRLSKKIAALNMMKLNEQRYIKPVAKQSKLRQSCGFVYLLSNEAFPGYLKIGIARDIQKRLITYQTADPLRRFKIEHYLFVHDKREVERRILSKFQEARYGEWVKLPPKVIIDQLKAETNEPQ
jgi:hypothetical protein